MFLTILAASMGVTLFAMTFFVLGGMYAVQLLVRSEEK